MVRKVFPKVFLGLVLLTSGVLWLAGGLSELNFGFEAFCGVLLAGIGLTFAVSAVCYRSPGYLYFLGVLGTVGAMLLMDAYAASEALRFKHMWVLLIAAPGVGSLIMFFARRFAAAHIKFALLFIGVAVLVYLAITGIVRWTIMIPAIVVLVGLLLLANVIFRKGRSWDTADNELEGYVPFPDRGDDEVENEERKN